MSDERDGRLKQPRTMLGSTFVAADLDDDMVRRLINAIEESCGAYDDERPYAETVEECIDGDYFLAYRDVRTALKAAYPEWYADE